MHLGEGAGVHICILKPFISHALTQPHLESIFVASTLSPMGCEGMPACKGQIGAQLLH